MLGSDIEKVGKDIKEMIKLGNIHATERNTQLKRLLFAAAQPCSAGSPPAVLCAVLAPLSSCSGSTHADRRAVDPRDPSSCGAGAAAPTDDPKDKWGENCNR